MAPKRQALKNTKLPVSIVCFCLRSMPEKSRWQKETVQIIKGLNFQFLQFIDMRGKSRRTAIRNMLKRVQLTNVLANIVQ